MRKKILVTGSGGSAAVCFMKAIVDPDVELHAADVDPFAPGLYLVPPEHRHLIRRGNHPYFVAAAVSGFLLVAPVMTTGLCELSRRRRTGERLQIVDEALASDNAGGSRLPWEEVRDWFHMEGNYVDSLDRAAEKLAVKLSNDGGTPTAEAIERYLREALAISLIYSAHSGLREFDATMGHLVVDQSQPAESQRFQLAHQLVALALKDEISAVIEGAGLRTASTCTIQPLPRPARAWLMRKDTISRCSSVLLALSSPLYNHEAIKEPFLPTITPLSTTAA